MKVEVSIGETHRFELREALLIYRGNQRSFITRHEVSQSGRLVRRFSGQPSS
jgi:hypothetical protein